MSSVGKAKEHETWKKYMEEQGRKVKITWKRETDEELKARILSMVRGREVPTKDLVANLRLRILDQIRLNDLIDELVRSNKITLRKIRGVQTIRG